MHNIKVGYALCGSFCTLAKSLKALEELAEEYGKITPIMSQIVYNTDTRLFKCEDLKQKIDEICGEKIIHTISD